MKTTCRTQGYPVPPSIYENVFSFTFYDSLYEEYQQIPHLPSVTIMAILSFEEISSALFPSDTTHSLIASWLDPTISSALTR
jgi:hypothetical protein